MEYFLEHAFPIFYAMSVSFFAFGMLGGYMMVSRRNENESDRKSLKKLDLTSYSLSTLAVLSAISSIPPLSNEFSHTLSKSAEFHALLDTVAPQPRDQLEEFCRGVLYRSPASTETQQQKEECKTLMHSLDQFEGWESSGQVVELLQTPTVFPQEMKDRIGEVNEKIGTYNAKIRTADDDYNRHRADIQFISVFLLFLTGLSGSLSFGLGLFRRVYEYRTEK